MPCCATPPRMAGTREACCDATSRISQPRARHRHRLALDGNDAGAADYGSLSGDAIRATVNGECACPHAPGHLLLGVVIAGMLPADPAMRHAAGIQREDQRKQAHCCQLIRGRVIAIHCGQFSSKNEACRIAGTIYQIFEYLEVFGLAAGRMTAMALYSPPRDFVRSPSPISVVDPASRSRAPAQAVMNIGSHRLSTNFH